MILLAALALAVALLASGRPPWIWIGLGGVAMWGLILVGALLERRAQRRRRRDRSDGLGVPETPASAAPDSQAESTPPIPWAVTPKTRMRYWG